MHSFDRWTRRIALSIMLASSWSIQGWGIAGEWSSDANTVALWHLNGNGQDASGNGNNLTLPASGAGYRPWGKFGHGLDVLLHNQPSNCSTGGASMAAFVPGVGVTYPGSGDWTVEAWVKYSQTDKQYIIVSHYSQGVGGQDPYALSINNGQAQFYINNGNNYVAAQGSVESLVGKWIHLVGIYRHQTSVELYANGQLLGTMPTSEVPQTLAGHNVYVGGDYCGIFGEMLIDEVRISDIARSVSVPVGIPFPPALTEGHITTIVGDNGPGYSGDGGLASAAQVAAPTRFFVDDYGNIYIAEIANDLIRKIDTDGVITTIAGTGVAGFSGDGGPADLAQFNDPSDIHIDSDGNMYIADYWNRRIRKIDTNNIVSSIAGNGGDVQLGSPHQGAGGPATSSNIGRPHNIFADELGDIYFTAGNTERVHKVSNGIITTVIGNGVYTDGNDGGGFSGDGGPASAGTVSEPGGVYADQTGIYIGDTWNNRIRHIAPRNPPGNVNTIAGNGGPAGKEQGGLAGDGGLAYDARLFYPSSVWRDPAGRIYFADHFNYRVRKIDTNNIITTIAGSGPGWAPGFNGTSTGDGGPADQATLSFPAKVIPDGKGNIFVSEGGRIRMIAGPQPEVVAISHLNTFYNQALQVPVQITANSGESIVSAELFIAFDGDLLTPFSSPVSATALTSAWTIESNIVEGNGTPIDTLKIAMADEVALTGSGDLLRLGFNVANVRVPASSPLSLVHALLNDGTPQAAVTDGSVTIVGSDAAGSTDVATIIPRETITVTITDADEDLDGAASTDQITVVVSNGAQTETLTLNETAISGEFAGSIGSIFSVSSTSATNSSDGVIQAQAGDQIGFAFVDQLLGDGSGPVNLVLQVDVIGGSDGSVEVTQVTQPGDTIFLKVIDTDLNTDIGAQETTQVVVTSSNGESETVTLTELDVDDDVFFGALASGPGAAAGIDDDGTINGQKGDVLTATYDDVVTALGDQLDRTNADQVIDPFGDVMLPPGPPFFGKPADGVSGAVDAAAVLGHVLSPYLAGLDVLQANVDTDPVGTGITPFDASLILQKRVGLISVFPVQLPASLNHPQATPSSPKRIADVRPLYLVSGAGYISVMVDDRAGIISGEVLLEGIEGRVVLPEELGHFLTASRTTDQGLRIVFAGAEAVSGSGELLRVYGASSQGAQLASASFNDGSITAQLENGPIAATPATYALHANVPNPFNPETVISFDLAQDSPVQLVVYDVLGQQVRSLVSGFLPAGAQRVLWDGRNQHGSQVSSGVYFYRLEAGEFVQTRRMLLLK